MRRLLDETHGENVELTDGIRIGRDGGWVLVLPDASDPIFNVYAEGDSSDGADRHAEELAATHRSFSARLEDTADAFGQREHCRVVRYLPFMVFSTAFP